MKETTKATLRLTQQGGVQYTFENGYTLSIGCGTGHYSSNYAHMGAALSEDPCTEVEVAVRNAAGGFVALPMDVAGYVPVGNLPSLFAAVQDKDWERVCNLCGELYGHEFRDLDPMSTVSQPCGVDA